MLTLALYLSCKTVMLSIVRPCKGSVMYACLSGKKRRGQKTEKEREEDANHKINWKSKNSRSQHPVSFLD